MKPIKKQAIEGLVLSVACLYLTMKPAWMYLETVWKSGCANDAMADSIVLTVVLSLSFEVALFYFLYYLTGLTTDYPHYFRN